mmetsp:Transcript_15964/g.40590  ORF Transcript_15964/g.40590 Transcript_15964/m.40590 type:complete len:291 (-) Transcript_15964:771-1643(-)
MCESMFARILDSTLEPHVEAHRAPVSALGAMLASLRTAVPFVDVVVGVHEVNPQPFRVPHILRLSDFVLLARVNVRIVEKNCHLHARACHLLDHRAGARCTARVQQHLHLLAAVHGNVVEMRSVIFAFPQVPRPLVEEQASVAVAQEAVRAVERMAVNFLDALLAIDESADEKHERGVWHVKVCHERVHEPKAISRNDAQRRRRAHDAAVIVCGTGERSQSLGCAHVVVRRWRLHVVRLPLRQCPRLWRARQDVRSISHSFHAEPVECLQASRGGRADGNDGTHAIDRIC